MAETSQAAGSRGLTGTVTVLCLGSMPEEAVRSLLGGDSTATRIMVEFPPNPAAGSTGGALREVLARADLVITDGGQRFRLDRERLTLMTRCRLIQQPSVGFEAIDHRAAADLGIPVANCAGSNRDSVADWVVMGILNLIRHGAQGDRILRRGAWGAPAVGRELGALTVGIVGLGNVGSAVAVRLRAFGCPILFTDVIPRSLPGAEEVSLEELLSRSDVVTVHVPLDHDTHPLIGSVQLRTMRDGAILVNASRGPVVDEAALIENLDQGHLAGAALDVFEHEPLAEESPLRRFDNVFITSHSGGNTREARARGREMVGANLRRVIAGLEPFNVVNGVGFRR
ncbi:MAG TPA: 2-hydroxyacid dehydrogenase [Candidatus Dormibacteraeota bacterium]|jgi:D-3-phosphoglycerate dehydrogenase|nr:2-hydroxyacid dehydrogenase [Candidatus Dormibacteraeota bacterium]